MSIESKIGGAPLTLNDWVRKAEVDRGDQADFTTKMADNMKALARKNCELQQADVILRKASAYFAPALSAASGDSRAAGRSSTAH